MSGQRLVQQHIPSMQTSIDMASTVFNPINVIFRLDLSRLDDILSQIALHPSIRFPLRRLPPVHHNLLHSVFHLAMSPSIHPPIAVSAHHQTSYTVYHIAASSWSSDHQPQVVNEIGSNQYILIIRCVDGCHYLTSNTIYPGVEPAGNIWPARVHQHRVCRLER